MFSRDGGCSYINTGNVGIETTNPNAALEIHNILTISDGTSVTSIV